MSLSANIFIKTALSALHYSGLGRVAAPFASGRGIIFMLHHVSPDAPKDFEPNRILKVTPDFLECVIDQVVQDGYDVIALDDVPERLASSNTQRPFACFTFDDGYRDNRDYAYPIFKKRNLPFTVYVPSEFPSGNADLWWLTLEDVIGNVADLTVEMYGEVSQFQTGTADEKYMAFEKVYWWLRSIPEARARAVVAKLADGAGIDPTAKASELVLSWDELKDFAADPLVTIGGHTVNHFALAKLSSEEAKREMANGIRRLEDVLGQPVHHFSYPYGSADAAGPREFELARELGMKTAVTTRKGLLHAEHVDELTALPRFSLNGDFQKRHYVKVMMSGVPFALWSAAQRLLSARNPQVVQP